MKTKFENCPHCGKTESIVTEESEYYSSVQCVPCAAIVEGSNLTEAINLWNKRATPWIKADVRLPDLKQTVFLQYGFATLVGYREISAGNELWQTSEGRRNKPDRWMPVPK